MLTSILAHRQLLWNFVVRDLRGRYVGSVMGLFWNVLNPLILLATYTFVFSYVMRAKLPAGTGTDSYAIFLFCGMIPWIAFSEAITRSTTAICDNGNLVKKVKFPIEVLIFYIAVSSFIHEFLALGVLLILMAATGVFPGEKAFFLIPIFAVQLVFTLGLSFFLASLNVYIRDVAHIMGAVIMVWFFGTPIVYPLEAIPERVRNFMGLNPMAQLVETYRDLLLRNQFHSLKGIIYLAVAAALVFMLGYTFFQKSKKGFADLI